MKKDSNGKDRIPTIISRVPFQKVPYQNTCPVCGKSFPSKNPTAIYCSSTCYHRYYYKKRSQLLANQDVKPTPKKKSTCKKKSNKPAKPVVPSTHDWISVKEFAALHHICKQTVYNMEKRKQITILHLTSRLSFVRRDALNELTKIPNRLPPETNTISKKAPDTCSRNSFVPATTEPKAYPAWATAEEISRLIGIKKQHVYTYAHRWQVSKKRIDGIINYNVKPFAQRFKT